MFKMIDITRACRTCMKDDGETLSLSQTINIENSELEVAQALAACTMSQISEDDGLPQNICEECINALQISYAFKNQAIKAEEQFRQLLKSLDETKIKCESTEVKLEEEYEEFSDIWDEPPANTDTSFSETIDINLPKCLVCFKTFSSEKKLVKHLTTHKIKNYIDDDMKDKNLVIKQEDDLDTLLNLHLSNNEENPDIFKCTECSQSFSKKRSLAMHMKKHKRKHEDKFVCDICSKEFAIKPLLKRHLKLHSQDRPFVCMLCPKKYSRQDQLLEHVKKHDCRKSYVCPHCDKGFTQQGNLQDHIRIHTGENPFLCSECGKGFNNRSNLRQHMFRHTGLKPFSCSMCPKKFGTKAQHKIHMVTHTGEQPFKCELCGAGFTHSNSLKKHQRSHLGLRPFNCESCSRSFITRDHLKRHNRIHTGEKPYSCKFCSRSYAQSNDLVKHLRVHLGQNIYQCTICDEKFRLMTELKHHYSIHYQNNEINETNEKDIKLDISKFVTDKSDIDKSNTEENSNTDRHTVEVYSHKDFINVTKDKKGIINNVDDKTIETADCNDINKKDMESQISSNDALASYSSNDMEKKIHNITITFNNDGLRDIMPQDFTINIVPLKQ